ncbi:MAG TPA: hypothetical protein DDW54_04040 [Clostridiales bacterium]|nr:hypothetical protein [Clostridiales bacterium]
MNLPYPFVPPCIKGNFRTLYYWDTFFTNLGLIKDGYIDWARENVDDLLYALDVFGCVPNYTSKDGADYCSQPPLLGLMIQDIYRQTNDVTWLAKAVNGLEKEYCFWMQNRMTAIGLNQYGCNAHNEERLMKYYDYISTRVQLPGNSSDNEKIAIARNFIAEAESGEDYTPRYESHNALQYVQIDLNRHLYGVEEFLSKYFSAKDEKKSVFYRGQKEDRLKLIEKYCFNEKTGTYCDYNYVTDKKNEIVCAACFLPYYYGFAKDNGRILRIYDALKTKSGIVSCQDTGNRNYQWGYPNIWAPHQYFAYVALKNYGFMCEAEELRTGYTKLLTTVFEQTGTLWERYDENGAAKAIEYPTQELLGWTAGVYRFLSNE